MKRLIPLLGLIAAVMTILSLPIAPAEAAPPGCVCGGYQYTPQDWAQGSTCDEATTNLRNQAYAYIDCPDSPGTCSRVLVLTSGCHWDTYNGAWQVDGYVRYRCWWCDSY
jgi:hypothetical protein